MHGNRLGSLFVIPFVIIAIVVAMVPAFAGTGPKAPLMNVLAPANGGVAVPVDGNWDPLPASPIPFSTYPIPGNVLRGLNWGGTPHSPVTSQGNVSYVNDIFIGKDIKFYLDNDGQLWAVETTMEHPPHVTRQWYKVTRNP